MPKNDPPLKPHPAIPTWWGMAGVFPGELGVYEGDAWGNKLRFVADCGFHGGSTAVDDLDDADRLALLVELATDRGMAFFLTYGIDLRAPFAEERARLDAAVRLHCQKHPGLPLPVAQFVVKGGIHRFDRAFSLGEQLNRLTELLTPIVPVLRSAGIVPVIENHSDYYVSDLLELCHRVPGLDILLDTGNCFLIGERLDLIPDAAYPHIAATHFKDHWLRPDGKRLAFQLTGATLGEGHANLGAFYQKLLQLHPDPASIRMMIEWVPDPDKPATECLDASMRYLEKIANGHFQPHPVAQ